MDAVSIIVLFMIQRSIIHVGFHLICCSVHHEVLVDKRPEILGKLICEAAKREEETGEKILELLSSVCDYETFLRIDWANDHLRKYQCDILLDLCSYVKNYESQTGRSVLPALQPLYQSAPPVWSIDLSERKVSLLLELLKLQPEKKPVELTGWSDEESEVRIFLQCLPYISQLRLMFFSSFHLIFIYIKVIQL